MLTEIPALFQTRNGVVFGSEAAKRLRPLVDNMFRQKTCNFILALCWLKLSISCPFRDICGQCSEDLAAKPTFDLLKVGVLDWSRV